MSEVYIKCISTVGESDYLTAGKVYKAYQDKKLESLYSFVGDNGDEIFVFPDSSSHGTFEIVEAPPEKPMVSPELTPRSLGCFQQVADVLGKLGAEVELQKVIDYPYANPQCDTAELTEAFSWCDTPQGHRFWDDIDDGDVPEDYTPPVSVETKEQPKQSPESQPKFGDILHINGLRYVFVCVDEDGDYMATDESGNSVFVSLDWFDEYRPDPTQELREQILRDWQKQSLDHAYDTEVCRVESSVGDIINFILDNGYRKES